MSVDILGTSWDQCESMVQYEYIFTSTETRRLVRTDSPGRPPRLSHSSWTMGLNMSFWCLTSTEARRPIRDGDEWERGIEEWNLETGANPEGQGCRGPPPEQQDVKAASVLHCAATTVPRNCCTNCYAEQSHRDNVRSSAVGKQLKQEKSNSLSGPVPPPCSWSLLG